MAQLITASEVKQRVDNRDLDKTLITAKFIELAELKHIRPILTKALYNDVIANEANYTALIALVKEALAWFVYFELSHTYYISVTEQGFKFTQAQNTTNIKDTDLSKFKTWIYQNATMRMEDVTENLEDERYTLFDASKKITTKIIGGIIL